MTSVRERLIEIARRKERLIARADAQRVLIAASLDSLRGPIAIADKGLEAAHFLRAHPLLVTVAVAAVVVLRGRGILSLAGRGYAAWRAWKSLSSLAVLLFR